MSCPLPAIVYNTMKTKEIFCRRAGGWLLGSWLLGLALLFSPTVRATCTVQPVMRDDVLIVVNANSPRSAEVGDYYCEQRGIDPANVAQVYLPVAGAMQLDQFVSLRDQLIRFLQLNTLAGNEVPVVCDTTQGYTKYYCPESIDQIRRLTRIRYLVMIRGVPTHFYFTGSTVNGPTLASVDNYLRYWLLNYFAQDADFIGFDQRMVDFEDGRGMRSVLPSRDLELIVGRIDGITPENAKQQVDRVLAAERNGVFGKLVSSMYTGMRLSNSDGAYWKQWQRWNSQTTVYPSWHYLHGLFGELQLPYELAITHATNPECVTNNATTKKLPQDCVTRLTGVAVNGGNYLGPGNPKGVIPRPDQTLVYQGKANGYSSHLNFQSVLNWRDTDTCNTLCDTTDAVCRAASSDVYQEIDTRCVRVADGFIGYNFGSFPVGLMYGSPTGWSVDVAAGSDRWFTSSSGSVPYRAPEVREDMGFDDNYSLWFDSPDQVPGTACYASGDNLQQSPASACDSADSVVVTQSVLITERAVDTANPQVITVHFKYRGLGLSRDIPLKVRLFVHESVYTDATVTIINKNEIDYGWQTAASLTAPDAPADGTSWGDAVASFTLDPVLHQHPQYLFDGLKIRIASNTNFEGQLAIDTVTLDIDGVDIPLLNGSFTEGHRQLSGGDSAATFLSRLNGVAFWANLTHHGLSNGRSFDTHPYETLIYFLRGLPLGDAVWFAEMNNSGILYGDPLYSPIAVHLHYQPRSIAGAPRDTIDRQTPLALYGDTVNGTGSNVITTYSVDYCSGKDFFVCDQGQTWLPVASLQNLPGGSRDMPLGSWDASQLAEGDYTLRLSVTSANSSSGRVQTFNDYYPLSLQDPQLTGPVDLTGKIKTLEGQDVCAMILASGEYTFSCNPPGQFSLAGLPRGSNGTVKRQIFADGFLPKIDVLTYSTDEAIVLTHAGTCPNYNTPYSAGTYPGSAGKWIDISGNVFIQNTQTPVCAIILANGQHTFSCDGTGAYALHIPLDANGQFKLQVYADGYAPSIQNFDEFSTTNAVRMARSTQCQVP